MPSQPKKTTMKLRDLIKELVNHDMDSDVTVHAANGTRLLNIEGIDDHSERIEGDTDEPRLTLMCFKSECPDNTDYPTGDGIIGG